MTTRYKVPKLLTHLAGVAAFSSVPLFAGTFSTDFNSGIPTEGVLLLGNATAYDHSTGGVNNSGVLKLTTAENSQQSTFIIEDLDGGAAIGGFDANFKLRIGGGSATPADGLSFVFGNFSDAAFGEEGPGTIEGLSVVFDIYNNSGTEAPAIDLKWNGVEIATRKFPIATLRSGTAFWNVKVHADTDGTVDVVYNNQVIYTNFPAFRPIAGRFAFGARTGGLNENQFVDDLSITTTTDTAPLIRTLTPVGAGAHPEGLIFVELVDTSSQVDPTKITLSVDNQNVTPTVSKNGDVTTVVYNVPGVLAPNSNHTYTFGYANNAATPVTNKLDMAFTVGTYPTIPEEYALSAVDTTKPGFKARVYQMPVARNPGDVNTIGAAERALAGGYIDPATSLPYENTADLSTADAQGWFVDSDVINWSEEAPGGTERGSFQATNTTPEADEPVPGIPGTAGTDNYVAEVYMFLELKAGAYRFGVNSDDGFKFSTARGVGDVTGMVLGSFNGGKGTSDVMFDFAVTKDGFYPFRLLWWEGGSQSNLELFMIDPATGQKVLINDDTAPVKSYYEAPVTYPYLGRVRPEAGQNFVLPDADIVVELLNGTVGAEAGSLVVQVNDTTIQGTVATTDGTNSFTRIGSNSNLLRAGANTLRAIYSIRQGETSVFLTNTWSFNVLQYGVIPAANKVPAGSVTGTGFNARVHQIYRLLGELTQGNNDRFPGDGNRMPRPEVQLTEGYINTATGQPFPNVAFPDADGDYVYEITDVLNFNTALTGTAPARTLTATASGVFGNDVAMPGLGNVGDTERANMSNGGLDNYVAEFTTYLDLKAGTYVFAVNSDDGFIATSAPNVNDTLGTILGFFNGGRGNANPLPQPTGNPLIVPGMNTGNSIFAAVVPEDGIYPVRVLYWQGGGGANMEFFSISPDNGTQVLVNDVTNGGIQAYNTYNGPARAWVKFSVSPTPWDNRLQQDGPGPLRFFGRTPNSIDAADLYNNSDADRPWADVDIGAILGNGAGKAIRMLLNGSEVTPNITTTGTDAVVAYTPFAPLPSGSTNTASLVYEGVTNSWSFVVQTYREIPASNKVDIASADTTAAGFSVKIVQAASGQPNTAARAESQLAGTPASVAVAGPEEGGRYIVPGIINWNTTFNTGATPVAVGNFQENTLTGWPFPEFADQPVPGIPGTGLTGNARYENVAAEVFAYLKFERAGYYRFGVNGDDGWAVKVGAPGVTNGTVLFTIDRGAGSADIPFSFTVPEPGLYPIRVLWYQGGGGGNLEFFSYDENSNKIPVNGTAPGAIKAYYKVQSVQVPSITITRDGQNITITWSNGGTLEASPEIAAPGVNWQSVDDDGSYTTTATGDHRFFRVRK